MNLDFLNVKLPRLASRRGPVNLYDLLELSQSEAAADRTLAYFLDPSERHGMGSALVDSLLSLLTNQPVLAADGRVPGPPFLADPFLGSSEWSVSRQVAVTGIAHSALSSAGIMDLYLTNDKLAIAVIIENKIDAPLNNPLGSYVRHAVAEGYPTVLLAVLAPREHALDSQHASWVTRAITYRALFMRFREISAVGDRPTLDSDLNMRRSLDLLEQFRETRERSVTTMGYTNDTEFVNEFRQMLSTHKTPVEEFFDAVKKINALFRERSKRLEPLLREQLDTLGVNTGWEGHGQNAGRWVTAWNAYHLVQSNNSIELIMTPDPKVAGPITVKAYPGRTYKFYSNYDHITFGVDWQASDEEVAEAFIAVVRRLVQEHPEGS